MSLGLQALESSDKDLCLVGAQFVVALLKAVPPPSVARYAVDVAARVLLLQRHWTGDNAIHHRAEELLSTVHVSS